MPERMQYSVCGRCREPLQREVLGNGGTLSWKAPGARYWYSCDDGGYHRPVMDRDTREEVVISEKPVINFYTEKKYLMPMHQVMPFISALTVIITICVITGMRLG